MAGALLVRPFIRFPHFIWNRFIIKLEINYQGWLSSAIRLFTGFKRNIGCPCTAPTLITFAKNFTIISRQSVPIG